MCAIAIAHAGLAALLMRDKLELHQERPGAEPMVADIFSPEVRAAPSQVLAPIAFEQAVELALPALSIDANPEPQRDAPKIDPDARIDVATYSARAHLPAGAVATVILLLEIAPDGSVMSATVVRSNEDAAANEAAIEYARATRWTPGMIDGEPRAMQASLTVILGENR